MKENCLSGIAAKENTISCLAFQLWEKAGRPEGRDLEFWLGAETHILASQKPEAVKVETVVPKPSIGKRVPTNPFQHRSTSGSRASAS